MVQRQGPPARAGQAALDEQPAEPAARAAVVAGRGLGLLGVARDELVVEPLRQAGFLLGHPLSAVVEALGLEGSLG